MLPYEELRIEDYYLLVVEKEAGVYRLYVGVDGQHYTHYDTGQFPSLRDAVEAARKGFDPTPYNLFPFAPFDRELVVTQAPHGFDSLAEPR